MKTKLLLLTACAALMSCITTETVNPDGSVTKTTRVDIDGVNAGSGAIIGIGGIFARKAPPQEFTYSK